MGRQWKQWQTLYFWGSKVTADGDCSHEIKRPLLLGRKVTTNLDSLLTSLVAQRVRCLFAMRESWVRSLGWDDPREKEMATHFNILAWRIPWTEEPGRLQSIGSQRAGRDCSDLAYTHNFMPPPTPIAEESSIDKITRGIYCNTWKFTFQCP